jgi:ATPase subunit of ABC transporter with duplicated ATPase domains
VQHDPRPGKRAQTRDEHAGPQSPLYERHLERGKQPLHERGRYIDNDNRFNETESVVAHASGQTAVQLRGLSAGYARHTVLHKVSAEFPRAKVTAVVGPNGSGKSTLLGVLAGVITPAAGDVEIGTRRPAFVVQHSAVPAGLPISVWDTVVATKRNPAALSRLRCGESG